MCGMLIAAAGIAETGNPLTLEQALELARRNSPELRAARMNTLAAETTVDSVGLWSNPELKFEAEGVGGDLDGFDDTEYTVLLSQKFRRGGKRRHEREVALQSVGIAGHMFAERELALLAEVRLAFIEVITQQEIDKVRSEQEQLGRAFVKVATSRYETGGGGELEVVQAELALEEIILAQTCCFGDLKAARARLASLIGISVEELGILAGEYYELDSIRTAVIADSHPALLRLDAEIEVLRAQAMLDRSRDTADIKLGAGYRYEAADDNSSFVFGASIPLNFIRGGRAAQAVSLAHAEALEVRKTEVHRRLQQDLSVMAALYEGAKLEAAMVHDSLMPKAEQAYELSKAGYEAGRFSWIELISSQQHLADIRIRHIEALRDAHFARAEITKFMKEGI
jgi:cobalt-zinc-cadmium efflux system outer membrane protein